MTPDQTKIISSFQTEAPVDITALATGLGLVVYDDHLMEPGISGMIVRDSSGEAPSGFVISVNANEAYTRRRFTVAHECAHYLRHRDKIGDGIFDDAMYRSERMNSQEEFEANNLAADLLMPRHLILGYVRSGLSNISFLAKRFQVSESAMGVRMRYIYRTP